MKASPLAVAERELLRLGRRWQTMAVRTGFALLLFLLVGGVYVVQSELKGSLDVVALHGIGRDLFRTWAWLQFASVLAITPLMVGQAIIDEKDEQTLELLAITRLTPEQILWGKLISRLIGVEAMMLAGLPVLAVVLGFGGVGPIEMFGAFALANIALVTTGAVATFCALYARSPVIVALQTWGWLWVGWMFVGPSVASAGFVGSMAGVLSANPATALGGILIGQAGGGLYVLAPIVVWGAVAWAVMKVAAVCFTTLALGNPDPDAADADLSAGFWRLDGLVRKLWPLAILCFLTTPLMFLRPIAAKFVPVLPDLMAYGWLTLVYGVGGIGYLLLIRRRTLKQNAKKKQQGGGRKISWKKVADYYDQEPGTESGAWESVEGAGEGRAQHVGDALAGKRKRRRRLSPFNRDVWDDPVAWRESVTAAHGQLRRSLAGFYILTGVLFAFVLLAGGFDDDGVCLGFGGTLLGFFVPPLLLLLATSSIVGERRAGSLELLCATKLTALDIVRGKLFGVGYYIGPAMLLGTMLMLAGSAELGGSDGPVAVMAGLVWYWALMLALALFAMWRALAVKAPSQAWAVNILTPALLAWLALVASVVIVEEGPELAWAWGLVVPFTMGEHESLLPLYMLLSAGFWMGLAGLFFLRTASLLRRHAAAM